ncbi:meiosis-specific protein MEI4-like [Elysia marginata]|uniref:Meiosis-specific protein MEI4-like n=1 Tax=Elysia marginata TaxID=1093978 RepID=A0AAV4GT80_9GAST|nr:meiosis-specific protein MEI4-like [Elysia marginata]
MKLAVAVAIIRNKPQGKSGKEHAEDLRVQYFTAQANLQDRSSTSKTKQQPTLTRDHVHAAGNEFTPPSSSDFDASFADVYVHPSYCPALEQTSVESSKFSRSLIALQNLSRQNLQTDVGFKYHEALTHLRSLREVLGRGLICLPEACLCQAAHTIAVVVATFPEEQRHQTIEPDLMQEVCSFVELVVEMLTLQPTDFGQYPAHRQKHSLVRMLLVFIQYGSLPLALSIVDKLTESLESLCASLKDSLTTGKLVDADWFENSYFTVQCVELTLSLWQRHCPAQPTLLQELQARLEACLVGITDRFPLVAQAVWKIMSLIEAILQNRW